MDINRCSALGCNHVWISSLLALALWVDAAAWAVLAFLYSFLKATGISTREPRGGGMPFPLDFEEGITPVWFNAFFFSWGLLRVSGQCLPSQIRSSFKERNHCFSIALGMHQSNKFLPTDKPLQGEDRPSLVKNWSGLTVKKLYILYWSWSSTMSGTKESI